MKTKAGDVCSRPQAQTARRLLQPKARALDFDVKPIGWHLAPIHWHSDSFMPSHPLRKSLLLLGFVDG
jgi:hypothetical protein